MDLVQQHCCACLPFPPLWRQNASKSPALSAGQPDPPQLAVSARRWLPCLRRAQRTTRSGRSVDAISAMRLDAPHSRALPFYQKSVASLWLTVALATSTSMRQISSPLRATPRKSRLPSEQPYRKCGIPSPGRDCRQLSGGYVLLHLFNLLPHARSIKPSQHSKQRMVARKITTKGQLSSTLAKTWGTVALSLG